MNLQTIHTIYYWYSVPGKGHDLTHSEIAEQVRSNADLIAELLKHGHDVELRVGSRVEGLRVIEVRKKVICPRTAPQGGLRRFDALG